MDQTARAIRNQRDYTREIERTSAAQRRMISDHGSMMSKIGNAGFMSRHGLGGMMLGGAAGYLGAHGIVHASREAIEKGAERQHVRIGAMNAGIGSDELQRMEAAAVEARKGAPNMSVSEIMELHKETRSAVQHAEEAFHLIPDLAKAASILKGAGATNQNIADIVKGGESLGLFNDPHRFHSYLEGQIKARNVMGKTIDTTQIYEAAKYSKSAGANLSDRFLNTVLPSLIQEMHGSSAGDALSMMTKTFRGGMQHKHLPVEKLNDLGLLEDPSQIRRNKAGTIMGYKGKLKGDALPASDPDRWVQEYLKPAATKKGITSLADLTKLASEILPSTAANLVRIFMQQEQTLKNHAKLYENAPGLDQASQNQRRDPISGMSALKASLDDLASSVTAPHMENVAKGLNTVSEGIRSLSNVAKDNPNATTAIAGFGAVSLGLGAFNTAVKGLAALNTMTTGSGGIAGSLAASSAARWALLGRMGIYGGAIGAGALAGMGLQAVGSVAAGRFYTPKDATALNDLKEQLDEVDTKMKGIRETSKMPEIRNMLLAPLAAKAADLRNRIAQGEAAGAGNNIVWSDSMNQFPMTAGRLGSPFGQVLGRQTFSGMPGGSTELGHIPAGGFFPPVGSGAAPSADVARNISVNVTGEAQVAVKVEVASTSALLQTVANAEKVASMQLRPNTGKSSPGESPGGQLGHSGD